MSKPIGKLSIDTKISSIKDTLHRLNAGYSLDKPEEKLSRRRNASYSNIDRRLSLEPSQQKESSQERSLPEVAELIRSKDKFITELLNDIEESRNSHKSNLASRDLELKELQKAVDMYKSEFAMKEQQIFSLQRDKSSLSAQANELSLALQSSETVERDLRKEISQLKSQLSECDNERTHLIRQEHEHKETIDKLESSKSKQKNKLQRLKELISEQEIEINDLKTEKKKLISIQEELEEEASSKNSALEAFELEQAKLEDKVKELKRLLKETSDKKYHLDDKEQMFKELEESWEQRLQDLFQENKDLKKIVKKEKSTTKLEVPKTKRNKSETKSKSKDPLLAPKLNSATASKIIREIMTELKLTDHSTILSNVKKLKDMASYQELANKLKDLIAEYYPNVFTQKPTPNSIWKWSKKTFKDFFDLQKQVENDQNALKKIRKSLNEESNENLPKAVTILLSEYEHLGLLINKVKCLLGLSKKLSVKELEEEINNRL